MDKFLKTTYLPWAVLATGVLGAALRLILFSTGLDEKGLLVSGHPAGILLWLLTLAVGIVLVLGTWRLKQAPKYSFNFPASAAGAVGMALAAVGVLVTAVPKLFTAGDYLVILNAVLGILSTAALGFLASCRWKGKHPSGLFHMVICVYLMIDLVCLYRQWSSDPQIQDYCFSLLASVSIMLACYYSAAFCSSSGDRQMHTLFHLAAVFFCLLSLPRCDSPAFYLTMAVWMFTDLCNLTPLPRTAPDAG